MNKEEKTVAIIVFIILALAIFLWITGDPSSTSIPENPCLPDHMGGCN